MDYSARLVFARIPKQIAVNLAQVLYVTQLEYDIEHTQMDVSLLLRKITTYTPCKLDMLFLWQCPTSWIQYCAPLSRGLSVDLNHSKKQC